MLCSYMYIVDGIIILWFGCGMHLLCGVSDVYSHGHSIVHHIIYEISHLCNEKLCLVLRRNNNVFVLELDQELNKKQFN